MSSVIKRLASIRLTLIGMALLAVGAMFHYGNPADAPLAALVIPLLWLSINLLAAIATNRTIQNNKGLLLFHIGLLGIVLLAAIGRLTFFEAHIEMVQGTRFEKAGLFDVRHGPFHSNSLDKLDFVQGPYTVDYAPGMRRGLTHSAVSLKGDDGVWQTRDVGDDRPLVVDGYRFYTSFNKGFAPVMTWLPDNGEPATGTVNMPSYPMFEFKQANSWTPPNLGPTSEPIKFWLRLDTGLDEQANWVLDGSRATGTLVVNSGGQRVELLPGDEVGLSGGRLRYEELRTWMGYWVFYDPTLHGLFICSMMAVFGLAIHLWRRINISLPLSQKNLAEQKLAQPTKRPTPITPLSDSRPT